MRKVRSNMLSLRLTGRPAAPFAFLLVIVAMLLIAGCDSGTPVTATPIAPTATPASEPTSTPEPPLPTATTIATPSAAPIPAAERGFVPILTYHHVRDWRKADSKDDRAYIVTPANLEEQLKWLKETGYNTVSSQQVYEYYADGKALPDKPIMLSFDDSNDNQYTNAFPLLTKYGFKGTFFIMTVTIGQENYMTAEQIKQLDKEGQDVQPHTWDHNMVTKYATDADWQKQMVEPKETLEKMLGHPTPYFAYPFGIYDAASARKIASYGYKAAFRLAAVQDPTVDPIFAIKRYIANGYWDLEQFRVVVEGGWEK